MKRFAMSTMFNSIYSKYDINQNWNVLATSNTTIRNDGVQLVAIHGEQSFR